eukprot:NODE_10349_length_338_cov_15.252595_g9438_i0.p1 GENE.NODE_10349_length_338_cov_15.252595_g9438_i0~~NODE_10349_length_338_cov_15.252595_g9438_i0.p1  ORF type:complete len:107 (+),score=12.97 NODE_10349_length_338_cov_15.252595_g9438_i0:41-322(+)
MGDEFRGESWTCVRCTSPSTAPRPQTCPKCLSGDVVPIRYELSPEVMQEEAAGRAVYGGCTRRDSRAPDYHCKRCRRDFFGTATQSPGGLDPG